MSYEPVNQGAESEYPRAADREPGDLRLLPAVDYPFHFNAPVVLSGASPNKMNETTGQAQPGNDTVAPALILEQISAYRAQVASLAQDAAQLREQLRGMSATYALMLSARENALCDAEARCHAAEAQAQAERAASAAALTRLRETETELSSLTNKTTRLESNGRSLEAALHNAQMETAEFRQAANAAREQTKAAERRLTSEMEPLRRLNMAHTQTNQRHSAEIQRLRYALDASLKGQTGLKNKLEAAAAKTAAMAAQAQRLEEAVHTARLSAAAKDKIIEELAGSSWWRAKSQLLLAAQ